MAIGRPAELWRFEGDRGISKNREVDRSTAPDGFPFPARRPAASQAIVRSTTEAARRRRSTANSRFVEDLTAFINTNPASFPCSRTRESGKSLTPAASKTTDIFSWRLRQATGTTPGDCTGARVRGHSSPAPMRPPADRRQRQSAPMAPVASRDGGMILWGRSPWPPFPIIGPLAPARDSLKC